MLWYIKIPSENVEVNSVEIWNFTILSLLKEWKINLYTIKNVYFCNSLLAKGVDWIIKIHVSLHVFDLQEWRGQPKVG